MSQGQNHLARSPGLDTLRALAILLVIPFHALLALDRKLFPEIYRDVFRYGWVGVDLFFVLSGYLIGGQLIKEFARSGTVNYGRFYVRRSLRILPAYYFVLALYVFVPAFRERKELDPAWHFAFFTMNYGRVGEAFSHAWSLCVEEHFYLIAPIFIYITYRSKRAFKSAPLGLCAVLFMALLAERLWLSMHEAHFYVHVYRKSHTHFDGLLVGALLAACQVHRPHLWAWLTARPAIFLAVGAAFLGAGLFHGDPEPFQYVTSFSFLALGFGAWVIAALSPEFWLANLRIPGVALIAQLAFTIYLTHKPMLHLAKIWIGNPYDHPTLFVLTSMLLIPACSAAIHWGVEKPFLKWRDLFVPTRSDAPNSAEQLQRDSALSS